MDDDGWYSDVDFDIAVRPALHLNLSSSTLWSYAGKVTSEGGGGCLLYTSLFINPKYFEKSWYGDFVYYGNIEKG